ncbi:MAG: DUF3667 domain-containing protein [Chitinophagaceae bacterium]|nr:MAG: DUF3667 domain-containing protein [Chitinophagaceae bacterium]
MVNCTNCNTEVALKYCPNCGQPKQLTKIDLHYIKHEIEHVFHFEKGIFYTVRELLINPGKNVRKYLTENRSRLVKPIIFIIITSLLYSIALHFFHVEDKYVKYSSDKVTTTTLIFSWIRTHYGYANIIMGAFIALWTWLFFIKSGYNFFEILILLCFTMGMGMLILAIFVTIQGLTHVDLMQAGSMISVAYCVWAIGHFFNGKKIVSYLKALIAYILGMASFFFLASILGVLIDLVAKN